ncbi:hypothetical protein ZIOFF_062779 [Zingiber officinale]|uniref:XPG-I domain-containing protein n=1 Tax=Zingiber officinale TaxID=94328 RepID=A0A8J5F1K4_ZINOF|nr:hypothetical protein ZIOFF_062779 [Zingiber officinale]
MPVAVVSSLPLGVDDLADLACNKVLVAAADRDHWYHWATRQASHLGDQGNDIDFRAAVVTAVATLLGLERGFSDSIFGMSVVFSTLVMYDAQLLTFAVCKLVIWRELKVQKKDCQALYKSDKVFAVALEDMDTLTFGALRFLHHLMDPNSKKISVMEFEVSRVLEELRLTMDQFIDLCILSDVIIVIALKYDNACVVEYGASAATVTCLCYLDLI